MPALYARQALFAKFLVPGPGPSLGECFRPRGGTTACCSASNQRSAVVAGTARNTAFRRIGRGLQVPRAMCGNIRAAEAAPAWGWRDRPIEVPWS